MINKTLLYYWLSIARIKPLRLQKLLEIYSIEELFLRIKKDKKIKELTTDSVYEKIVSFADEKLLTNSFNLLKESGVEYIGLEDDKFPLSLKQAIVQPPAGLFYKGDITLLSNDKLKVSVVGARRCSSYGKDMAFKFSSELTDYNIVIVSGLATGIDAYAHDAALKSNGKTIAVLGMGHNCFYPLDNIKLFNKINEVGLTISEYPPNAKAEKYTFPERNRLIAGLSDATVIIEASSTSGSLITANLALEQNKEIFAVPANITSPKSQGTNNLIKRSQAKLLSTTSDILEFFSERLNLNKNATDKIGNKKATKKLLPALDIFEQKIYNALEIEQLSFDNLKEKSGFETQELLQLLMSLEIKNVVVRLPHNEYRLVT